MEEGVARSKLCRVWIFTKEPQRGMENRWATGLLFRENRFLMVKTKELMEEG